MIVFTSEEAAVNALSESPFEGESWAWMDSPHFGPVAPAGDLETFSRERATYFKSLGWDESDELEADFRLRNAALANALAERRSIALLFGHSPRDQLTLARMAHFFTQSPEAASESLLLASVDGAVSDIAGTQLAERVENACPFGLIEQERYARAWSEFAGSDSIGFCDWTRSLEGGCLKRALNRMLREYPSLENGLSLTEAQILDSVALGVREPRSLFERIRETEASPFLNDWEFWVVVERLTLGGTPLLERSDGKLFERPPVALAWKAFDAQVLQLTSVGEDVLEGRERYTSLDFPSRWIGGVELKAGNFAFWDYGTGSLASEPEVSAEL